MVKPVSIGRLVLLVGICGSLGCPVVQAPLARAFPGDPCEAYNPGLSVPFNNPQFIPQRSCLLGFQDMSTAAQLAYRQRQSVGLTPPLLSANDCQTALDVSRENISWPIDVPAFMAGCQAAQQSLRQAGFAR